MDKDSKAQKRRGSQILVTGAVLIAMFVMVILLVSSSAGSRSCEKDGYYRGVQDTCLRSRSVDGQYTFFDVQVCREFTRHAQEERWYEKEMVK